MQYRLSTLMILAGVGPPLIAFVWSSWWPIVFVALLLAALVLWVAVSWGLAWLFAEVFCSFMR